MKNTFTLFILLILGLNMSAQEQYSRARISLKDKNISDLAAIGVDVNEGFYKKGIFFETDLSAIELKKLSENGFSYNIIIADISSFYAQRAQAEQNLQIDRNTADEWPVPENWELGTMGGMYTLDQIMSELDDMATLYPDLISSRQPISETNLTHNGRQMFWVKISDNPNTDEEESEVLYTGLHHAREGIGPQQLIFFMWHLLENYETDEGVKRILDNTELYFVPALNPDGYEFNRQVSPGGGGMWRKNRRDNLDGTYGVDINRNYGFMWGNDDEGSSPYTEDETYRGPEAFSEPEIQNIRDFCIAHNFLITLNYHSFSNLLLSPWGYTPELPPDNDLLIAYAALMTAENGYTYGPGSTTIYPTNGGSDDWMYGEQVLKEKSFSYTPEVGSDNDGFWPSISRIVPLCQENMWQDMTAARLVGKYAVVKDLSGFIISETEGYLPFEITRLGLSAAANYTVSIEPLDEFITETSGPVIYESLDIMQSITDSISFMLAAGIESGQTFSYLLSVDLGDFIISDTITKIFGIEESVFTDDNESMENWVSNKWNTTTSDFHSPAHSITDSPSGFYQDDENNIITLDSIIDLRNVNYAFLRFWASWEIEKGYDFVQVQAKDIASGGWVALKGKYTTTGNNYQDPGKPVYDGMVDWVEEEINLSSFGGKQIQIRFRLVSDSYVTEDGFYFDDVNITIVDNTVGIDLLPAASPISISNAFPNPANYAFHVMYDLGNDMTGALHLYDSMGKCLISTILNSGKGIVNLDVSKLNSGIYFYNIQTEENSSLTRKIVIQ